MKLLSSLALTFFSVIAVMANEPMPEEVRLQNQYIEYRLMQGEIYRICVKMNDGVTQFSFHPEFRKSPGRISALTAREPIFRSRRSPVPIISTFPR